MSDHILQKFKATIPSAFKPDTNPVILALLTAVAQSDEFLETQVQNAKDQLFVASATDRGLDRIANSLGVSRPSGLGLEDVQFQNLIPNLSLKPRQIKKAFYDTGDVFWGPLFSRANIATTNTATFNLNLGDEFKIIVDNGVEQVIKIRAGDVAALGLATAAEAKAWLERINGITVSVLTEPGTGDEALNIRTNTPGSVGTLNILTASSIGTGKLEFVVGEVDILDLSQRFVVYNIKPNELVIEIPAIVPALRRTLLGSHHIHGSNAIELPQPPNNEVWQGSFIFNPDASFGAFEITQQKVILQATITAGDVLTTISVNDTSGIINPSGDLIFEFGLNNQEVPISYQGILNSNTISIDPSRVFLKNHAIGSNVNVISARAPLSPNTLGQDYAVYLPSPVSARQVVQDILARLKAAGIIIKFVVLAPTYRYRCDNPFLVSDDAPQC